LVIIFIQIAFMFIELFLKYSRNHLDISWAQHKHRCSRRSKIITLFKKMFFKKNRKWSYHFFKFFWHLRIYLRLFACSHICIKSVSIQRVEQTFWIVNMYSTVSKSTTIRQFRDWKCLRFSCWRVWTLWYIILLSVAYS